VVVDVDGEPTIRFGVIERLSEQDVVHRIGGRLDAARPGEVLLQCLADEIPERHPARPRRIRGASVQIAGQQQLRSMHV
jgi:hypothetical protein